MNTSSKYVVFSGFILLLFFSLSSCLNNKSITYFPTLKDTSFVIKNNDFVPKIQKGDLLQIIISSADAQSAALFNLGSSSSSGYLVERDGFVRLPKLGNILAVGKSKQDFAKEIEALCLPYLKDPIASIKFLNYRITVLGEVGHAGTFTSNNDRMTILEALGQSGDIGALGKRNNILVIRDSAGVSTVHRFSLLDNSIFQSPYYYLQSNDVLYVEPKNQKAFTNSQAVTIFPIITSVLSFFLIIYTTLVR